jgi:GxxExxY protein
MALLHGELTRTIIGRFFIVYNRLGFGHLENVYAEALRMELSKTCGRVEREVPIAVHYDGEIIGSYRVDLRIDNSVIIEVKAARAIATEHERQVLNYLKCSEIEVGLLFNFGTKPEFRRFLLTNDRKAARVADPWPFPSDPCRPA